MTANPTFSRVMYVGLSVTNLARSSAWYQRVLGLTVERSGSQTTTWDEVLLRHESSGLLVGLLQHAANDGQPFNETRAGLDHVEFEVPSLDELDSWRQHLDAEGVAHSGSEPHIVTFRDPDNIQLELFCILP